MKSSSIPPMNGAEKILFRDEKQTLFAKGSRRKKFCRNGLKVFFFKTRFPQSVDIDPNITRASYRGLVLHGATCSCQHDSPGPLVRI